MEDHKQRKPVCRGLNLTNQTKLSSLTLTVCPRGAQFCAVFGREYSLLIDDCPAHLLLPIISAPGQQPLLKTHSCYRSLSLLYIISSSPISPSISLTPQSLASRAKLCNTLTQAPSIYPPSFSASADRPPFLSVCLLSLCLSSCGVS